MGYFLARFISEVRREDEQEYLGKTLYEMVGSVQKFLHVQCKRNVILVDEEGCTIGSLNSALNFQMKEKVAQGVGVVVNQENL